MEESVKQRLMTFLKYKNLSQSKFEKVVGLSNGYLSQLRHAPGVDKISMIISTFPELNKEWLLTGEGEMLSESNAKDMQEMQAGIPLIPQAAMAGALGGSDNQWMSYQCERYLIPGFEDCDYLIRIEGDSMMPDYYPGDIVACKIVVMSKLWFQWGEVYILDTCQGALIKRILPSEVDGCVKIVSSNSKYPPFDLEVTEIHHVSLVRGLIRK